jgi:ATP-dependent helicase Lhr and Lhr-like helicase
MSFSLLHPAVQHHVAGSLGWRGLRPLQERAIEPLVAGRDALLLAPTAGGKTEAGVLPLASRMLTEGWEGLSVLYVSPLRALANNLEPRLSELLGLVGRRAAVWHGDVTASGRRAVLREPPDLLLTTPESLEAMLVSERVDHRRLFSDLRAVVIDEVHAFAGDDRGWHLRAVLARLDHLIGRRLQRVGLSATVGNPRELLGWLGDAGGEVVVADDSSGDAEVRVDHVGSLDGAATVIAGLHAGEKRLVFCDSRADVEQIAAALHSAGAQTYVSHSSLSRDDRRRAEEAFALGSDCVIVATSTLELGIDVGDLDRVIQIDAPATVASFLQRLGRSGRRSGSTASMLFLTTRPEHLLRALGLDLLRARGQVEPVIPPPDPLHILGQQLLALCLQEGRVGSAAWVDWLEGSGLPVDSVAPPITAHMLDAGLVHSDAGMLTMGTAGERSYGRRNFLDLLSVFTSGPLVEVRHGRAPLGFVHESSFLVRDHGQPVLLLGGRSWALTELDWRRRVAYVVPAEDPGRSRWVGSGPGLSFAVCRAMRDVAGGKDPPARPSQRAKSALAELRGRFPWASEPATTLATEDGRARWWTFAGTLANHELRWRLGALADGSRGSDELSIPVRDGTTASALAKALAEATPGDLPVDRRAVEELKFNECLPEEMATGVLRARARDGDAVRAACAEPIETAVF